jgi:agmatinase
MTTNNTELKKPLCVALLGIPFDENSSFEKGPALAPDIIRTALFSGSLNKGTEYDVTIVPDVNFVDAGNLNIDSNDTFISAIEDKVTALLSQHHPVLSFGGDHSVTYPIIRAYSKFYPELTIVHFDAHTDLYHEFKGNLLSNACPFARIMENKLASKLHQIGIRTLTDHQRQQIEKFNVNVIHMKDFHQSKLPTISGPVYISIDIDAIDPAFAPGVSHREPGGLSSREILNVLHQISGNIVGVDIVEFNPLKDIDQLTANLAAKLTKECIGKIIASNK